MFTYSFYLFCVLLVIRLVESTDLAAVYKHGVVYLKNADLPEASYSLLDKSLQLKLDGNLKYPVGLSYDPVSENLFIADANNYDADIFAFKPQTDSEAKLKKIAKKSGLSSIESIIYDPVRRKLYWTDSYKNAIFSIHTTGEEKNDVEGSLLDDTVQKPRGITIDYCSKNIYWSERNKKMRRITERMLLNETNRRIIEADEESPIFYQALVYDVYDEQLIWTETMGDSVRNSSCNILKFNKRKELEVYKTIGKCYPFSMTVDEHYIYWTDWSQEAILRLSKTDPKNLRKLMSTPKAKTKEGLHFGANGLVNLNSYISPSCISVSTTTTTPVPTTTTTISSPSFNKSPVENVASKISVELIEKNPRKSLEELTDKHILYSSSGNLEKNISSTLNALKEDQFSLKELKAMYNRIHSMFIVSTAFCLLFFLVAMNLLIYIKVSRKKSSLSINSPDIPPPEPVVLIASSEAPKKKKIFTSLRQAAPTRGCSNSGQDIEDCCQMMLCDRPCENMKDGKKLIRSPTKKVSEDKKCLLNNYDVV